MLQLVIQPLQNIYSTMETRTWVNSSCDLQSVTCSHARFPTEDTNGNLHRQAPPRFQVGQRPGDVGVLHGRGPTPAKPPLVCVRFARKWTLGRVRKQIQSALDGKVCPNSSIWMFAGRVGGSSYTPLIAANSRPSAQGKERPDWAGPYIARKNYKRCVVARNQRLRTLQTLLRFWKTRTKFIIYNIL